MTRVRILMRSKGATGGQMRIQVRRHSGGLPTTVVDETTLLESDLTTTFGAKELSFVDASNLAVSGACVVLQWGTDPAPAAASTNGAVRNEDVIERNVLAGSVTSGEPFMAI